MDTVPDYHSLNELLFELQFEIETLRHKLQSARDGLRLLEQDWQWVKTPADYRRERAKTLKMLTHYLKVTHVEGVQ